MGNKILVLGSTGKTGKRVTERLLHADFNVRKGSRNGQPYFNCKVILPPIKALEPFVDADDIADVAVVALTTPGHSEKVYELTGPELLSFAAATALISDVLHRPVMYEEISLQQYTAALKAGHVPAEYIELISYLFTTVLDGRNETTTNDIEKITGRKPGNFRQYVVKTATTGVWK